MNQSVSPLPFATLSEPAAVECSPLCNPQSPGAPSEEVTPKFDDLLDSEIQDEAAAEVEEPKTADPWTLYAFAATSVQILIDLPLVPVSGEGGTHPAGQGTEAEPAELPGMDLSNLDPDEKPPLNLVQLVRPVQQNVPPPSLPAELAPLETEQIAQKPSESGKKPSGIPAAQEPSMLRSSEKQEKSAEKQSFSLSAEKSGATSFDTTVAVRAANQFRDPTPRRDQEFNSFSNVDTIQPEWSSFDGISESVEIQAPRHIESTEVLQAIRSHVELLKTSNQQKLDVVLRPDGQTEIRLQVEKVNGEILLQARCERGDFARLESNWAAIQQSLANQGIRVEALQQGAAFQQNHQHFTGSSNSPEQHSNAQQQRDTKIFEQEASVPNRPKKPFAHSSSARGWQSWA
ncbi:MAG TPA: hypothetical protein VF773_10095 [Verrucomicrobiae bacterium]